LFGGVHGFDGLYPADGGSTTSASSFAIQAGGGLNLYLTKHWGVRLLEADYVRNELPNASDGVQNDLRLAFGVTYHLQSTVPPPVTLSVTASPATVFAGDPVTVTATASNLNPKLNVIYSFSGEGVTASGATATVATSALAPGTYTVKAQVKEGKAGKEGLKPWQTASCSTSFVVKAFEPPTLSCSASPSTIKPGETSTITATGMSPQNRPLSYSYSAAAGTINGTGTTAAFSSNGAPTGPVAVTCNVSDDKGQSATASTSVTIAAPYVAPNPHAQALCSITFSKDKKRPARVDNEAKACLDEVALDLQKQSDAKAVVVGNSDAKEKAKTAKLAKAAEKNKHIKVVDLAAERAVNTKSYLVTEKGIDASRISVATGTTDGQKVEDYLVPSGATFTDDVTGTTSVDEAVVKPHARKAMSAKHAAHKKAVKK
jgi:outer membrane protein OmpA-like peptidoglycan-associated protein